MATCGCEGRIVHEGCDGFDHAIRDVLLVEGEERVDEDLEGRF